MDVLEVIEQILVVAALTVFLAVFPRVLFVFIDMLKTQAKKTQTLIDDQVLNVVERFTYIVVAAAEQLGVSGQIENSAKAKKEYAIRELQRHLNSIGIAGISVEILSDSIEHAVRRGLDKKLVEIQYVEPGQDNDDDDYLYGKLR